MVDLKSALGQSTPAVQPNLNEAEAQQQAGKQALTAEQITEIDAKKMQEAMNRRDADKEAKEAKFKAEHFDADELKLQQAKLAEEINAVPEEAEEMLRIESGGHTLTVVPQKGLTYNYLASCTCAWQGRFLTMELAETMSKKHVFGAMSSAA